MSHARKKRDIDIAELRSRLIYDPDSGQFVWRDGRSRRPGKQAGSLKKSGYICIKFLDKCYFAHVLAWAYVHGKIPASPLDHINRNKADNRLVNLRTVSHSRNALNRPSHDNPTLGTTFLARIGKWQAQITRNGRDYYLGCFPTIEDANAAYHAAANRLQAGDVP